MTVSELIEKLKQMPQDALVVAEGYEDGYDTIKSVYEITLADVKKKEWYIGIYKTLRTDTENAFKAVLLFADTKSKNK